MRSSPVKLAVIAAAVVVGIAVLATAFDSGTTASVSAVTEVSPSVVAQPPKSPKPPKSPEAAGVLTGVYNGTTESNLASSVAADLAKEGYVIQQVGNTTSPTQTTTIYFVRPDDEAAATLLAEKSFNGAPVEAKPSDLKIIDESGDRASPNRDLQLLVFVGDDYLK